MGSAGVRARMSLIKPVETARAEPSADPKAAFAEAIHRAEDAFDAALAGARARAESAESALQDLQAKHDELVSRHAEAERKLAILHELKSKLDGL